MKKRSARAKIDQSLRDHVSTFMSKCYVCVHVLHVFVCMRAYFKKQAQKRRTELIIKKMKEWMNDWMLKAKMVQKACGDWRVDKPKWEEWWTVAQTSAALIPIFLYDLSNILIWVSIFSFFFVFWLVFLHTNKRNKANNQTTQNPKQCCNWWDMADVPEDFDSQWILQSSCIYVSSQLRVQAFCSSWLWCWCKAASWTLGGSSWGC